MTDDATPPDGGTHPPPGAASRAARRERKSMLLRLDPAVYDAVSAWAAHDLRSVNAHVEWLLRKALDDAGRLPRHTAPPARRGRPRSDAQAPDADPSSA